MYDSFSLSLIISVIKVVEWTYIQFAPIVEEWRRKFILIICLAHYRTRRTFKSNLRIIGNVNMAFVKILVGFFCAIVIASIKVTRNFVYLLH